MPASVVEKYLSTVVATQTVEEYRDGPGIAPYLEYMEPGDQALFAWFDQYVKKHKAIPSAEFIASEFGSSLPKPDGASEYWATRIERTHLKRGLAVMAQNIGENLNKGEEEALLAAARDAIHRLDMSRSSMRLFDFRNTMAALEKKWLEQSTEAITLGWPTLDEMMGGARGGDLISMVARPKLGKTYLLVFSALHVWRTYRLPVLFFSNEMLPEMIAERMAAIETHTPADFLKTNQWPTFDKSGVFGGKQSDNKVKKAFKDKMHLIEKDDVPIWIADGNLAATVDDVAMLTDKLGPCIVYADGAYLYQDQRERNPHARVALVTGDLKQKVATARRTPVFASWQFNRIASKKLKDGEKPGIEDIANSDSIGQLSSCVMGMFEGETVETKKQREVEILAGRSGETGSFRTNWDFQKMDLSEITQSDADEQMVMA